MYMNVYNIIYRKIPENFYRADIIFLPTPTIYRHRAGCETGARACPNLANAAEDRTNSTEGGVPGQRPRGSSKNLRI